MAGGGGPAGTVARAGDEAAGFNLLRQASIATGPAPRLTPANIAAVRRALRSWGVTKVVVPSDAGLARFQTGRGNAYGVKFFTAVMGAAPLQQDGAWVWNTAPSHPK
jgi:hypothetical protein